MKDSIFLQIPQTWVKHSDSWISIKMKDLPPILLCHPFSAAGSDLWRRQCFVLSPTFRTPFPYSFSLLKDMAHLHFPVLADQNLLIEHKRNQPVVVTLNSSPVWIRVHMLGSLITESIFHLCQHKCLNSPSLLRRDETTSGCFSAPRLKNLS